MQKLTKEQKFELEMIFKPKYGKATGRIPETNIDSFFKQLCNSAYSVFKDCPDEFIDFCSVYEDNIRWYNLVTLSSIHRFPNYLEFIDLFHEHFGKRIWDYLSTDQNCIRSNDFLMKYKDKLNWNKVSECGHFDIDDLIELQDDINLYRFFTKNAYSFEESPSYREIIYFVKNCLEKEREIRNGNKTDIDQTAEV